VGSRTSITTVRGRLTSGLRELKRARLKPQERMYPLHVHLLPSLYHQLELDDISQGLLHDMGCLVQKSMREWCRLAKDIPTSMFHAKPEEGGYGKPRLCVKVRMMRRDRISKLQGRAETRMTLFSSGWCLFHRPSKRKVVNFIHMLPLLYRGN